MCWQPASYARLPVVARDLLLLLTFSEALPHHQM
jgi:hypothetical protein